MEPEAFVGFDATSELLRALAHPLRLQILHAVRSGQLSVGEIEERTGIGQPGLSQQLSILRKAELVRSERSGKQVFYRVDRDRLAEIGVALAVLSGGTVGESASGDTPSPSSAPAEAPAGGAARFARVFR